MEKTPHVMLAGSGAERWALENGFAPIDLPMAADVKEAWEKWKVKSEYKPVANVENQRLGGKENHDTIGMVAVDANGRLAGSCTTSGLAWKSPRTRGRQPHHRRRIVRGRRRGCGLCDGYG